MTTTPMAQFEINLLGPITVRNGGEADPIRGLKQRILLTHLVFSNGRPVPIGRLVADLWNDAAPKRPTHALQEHVSRLRSSTGLDISLLEGAGYLLTNDAIWVDALEFLEQTKLGEQHLQQGDFDSAIEVLESAFSLWRGPIMEDLINVDGLRARVMQMEEAWHRAVSARIDAYLNSGRAHIIIGELRSLLNTDPLDEQAWYQLILALHLKGLRNDAILAFHEARETFIDTLGMGPSPRMQRLHEEILRTEPSSTSTEPAELPAVDDPVGTHPPTPLPTGSSLIGRRRESTVLENAWRKASTQGCRS